MTQLTTKLFHDDADTLVRDLLFAGIDARADNSGTIPSFWRIMVNSQQFDDAKVILRRLESAYNA